MATYIRPKQTYTTIGESYEIIDGVVHYLDRAVVKDADTAKDIAYAAENNLANTAFSDEPVVTQEEYNKYPPAYAGLTIVEEPPKKKYPQWPEWDIPEENYPPPVYVWIDYPEPEPEPDPDEEEENPEEEVDN